MNEPVQVSAGTERAPTSRNHSQAPRDAICRVRLLQQMRIMGPDNINITPKGKRSRAALAYLILTNGSEASRERLAGLLWSDRGEVQARASLRQCLYEIRAALPQGGEGILYLERDRVSLNAERLIIDVQEILAALRGDDLIALEHALERLGTDVILADLSVSEMFDQWLEGERAAWDARILAAVRQRIVHAADANEWADVRRYADAYLRRDAAAEDVLLLALRADAAVVGMAEARRRASRWETELRQQFDGAPSPRVRKLLEDLEDDPPLALTSERGWSTLPAASPPGRLMDLPTVVLTPFRALGGGDTVALADLVGEDIEALLSRFHELRVLSAAAGDKVLPDLANNAFATFVLLGTIRITSGGIALNVRLRGIDGQVVWALRETLPLAELETTADNIVRNVVGAVAPTIERSIELRLPQAPETTDDIVLAYCRARALARAARSLPEAKAAVGQLEAAITRDPLNVGAYLHLSRLYNTDYLHNIAGHDWRAMRDRALSLTRAASEMDACSAHVQTSLGWCYLRRGEWEEARTHLDRALLLSPYHADRVNEAGMGLAYYGDLSRAAELIELAIALNPFPHREYLSDRAVVQLLQGSHEHSERSFRAATDEALHYRTMRLANWGFLQASPARTALANGIRESFAIRWCGARSPTDSDIGEWLSHHMPLRDPGLVAQVREGLCRAGLRLD